MPLRTEYHEQKAVIEYLRIKYPEILLTIAPNGIKMTIGQAKKFKAMGYTSGTPDILIFEPRGIYKGLFLEMKKEKGGRVSENQKKWLKKANDRGYCAMVCYGFGEAQRMIESYFR